VQSSLHINFLRFHVNEGYCSHLIAGCAQACTENQFPVISTEHVFCSLFRSNRGPTDREKSITEREGEEELCPDRETRKTGIIDERKEAKDERIDKGRERNSEIMNIYQQASIRKKMVCGEGKNREKNNQS